MSSLSMFAKESLQPMFTVQSANRTETGAKINDIVCNYGFLMFFACFFCSDQRGHWNLEKGFHRK